MRVLLQACGSDGESQEVTFTHGVASGDPLADRVILWTRIAPKKIEPVELKWQIATDAGFADILRSGTVLATADTDFTAKVDAAGLAPARSYFYRFVFNETRSPAGRLRTLPAAGVAQVKLAVFSCANYPAGFFNVYADAAGAQLGVTVAPRRLSLRIRQGWLCLRGRRCARAGVGTGP
jgi:alkaline phosphatase D